MKARFLCYDLKGIQSFIFAVPRLRYVIGGSALVDEIDRDIAPAVGHGRYLYSAGGRGAYLCANDREVAAIQGIISIAAHVRGIDVAFGLAEDFATAANEGSDLRPFVPSDLAGEPCSESGLYPVRSGRGQGDGYGVHPVVWRRVWSEGERVRDRVWARLEAAFDVPGAHPLPGRRLAPFIDVADDDVARALGARNRWAVICMDGNDIGSQLRRQSKALHGEDLVQWLKKMSAALDEVTIGACARGVATVVERWRQTKDAEGATTEDGRVLIPVRPLVLGGDDLMILCHVEHARAFVKAACGAFEELAAQRHRETPGGLWAATGGRLTISAGVLYAPTAYPLHSAVDFAERLLASAKGRGREQARVGEPAPACIDWESVTDGLLETPADRRQRELRFADADLSDTVVELTRRPYTLATLAAELEPFLEQLRCTPSAIRHQILAGLRAGFWERRALVAGLAGRHTALSSALAENEGGPSRGSRWREQRSDGRSVRSTDVLDAILLLEEEARMEWETAR